MVPSFMELTLIKEDNSVTWKAKEFQKLPTEKRFLKAHKEENCQDQRLKSCKNRQIDNGTKQT